MTFITGFGWYHQSNMAIAQKEKKIGDIHSSIYTALPQQQALKDTKIIAKLINDMTKV